MTKKQELLLGIILVLLIVLGFLIDREGIFLPASEPWVSIISGFFTMACLFGLMALVVTHMKKYRPPIDVKIWEQVRKSGKWKFAFRRMLPVLPLLVLGLVAPMLISSGTMSISLGAIGTAVLLIVVLAIGGFFISAAVWDSQEADFQSAKEEKTDQSNS